MIYLTGDTHSDFRKFNTERFPEQKTMTKEDYVIICGDFGGIWSGNPDDKSEKNWLDWLSAKKFTTLFIDGNHENFDRLMNYPVEEWCGGKVHKITDSILHLMRGQVYHIEGKKFFTFGGAACHDIDGGILEPEDSLFKEKRKLLEKKGAMYRINHISWWKQELPTEEEMEEGIRNLENNLWMVDFVLTHCGRTRLQQVIGNNSYEKNRLTDYLEMIYQQCKFEKWFCGHYHIDMDYSDCEKILYKEFVRVL